MITTDPQLDIEVFWVKYSPLVRLVIFHQLRDTDVHADIDEVESKTFLRIFKDDAKLLNTFDPARASFQTFIKLIAASTAKNHLRDIRARLKHEVPSGDASDLDKIANGNESD